MENEKQFPENFKPISFAHLAPEEMPSAAGFADISKKLNVASLFIWGSIGGWWGVYGAEVYAALRGKEIDHINLYISSGGGAITDAFEIHDLLAGHAATVHAYIFSLAASAGTIVACPADKVFLSSQSMYMVHEGHLDLWGQYDRRKLASTLQMVKGYNSRVVDIYARRTGLSKEVVRDLMDQETWLEPAQAVEAGFADAVLDHIHIPFADAQITQAQFTDVFYEHTAAHARQTLPTQGFTPVNMSLIKKPATRQANGSAAGTIHNNNSNSMKFFDQLADFFQKNGITLHKGGQEMKAAEAAQVLADAPAEETAPIWEAVALDASTELVANAVAAAELRMTAAIEAATSGQAETVSQAAFDALTERLSNLETAAVQGQAGASGAQRPADPAAMPPAEETPAAPLPFSQGSLLHRTVTGQGIIKASEITALEQRVAKKRAETQAK